MQIVLYSMKSLNNEQISLLRATPSIADVMNESGAIKSREESKILAWHFGIVPGVISEDIARILAGISSWAALETIYNQALKPWTMLSYEWVREVMNLITPWVHILSTINVSWQDLNHFSLPDIYNGVNFDTVTLDNHLLQSGDFRLASGAEKMDENGNFIWHYHIPENHPFLSEGRLPFSFMKEVANQIIALSHSITKNTVSVNTGSTILLASAHVASVSDNPESEAGSQILVTGKTGIDKDNPKRWVIAEYTAHEKNNRVLFKGKVRLTVVPTKLLFR